MSRSRDSSRPCRGVDRERFLRRSLAAVTIIAAGLLAPPSVSAENRGTIAVNPSSGPIGTQVTVAGDIDRDCSPRTAVFLEIGELRGIPTPDGEATAMRIGKGEEIERWYTVKGTIPARITDGRVLTPGTEQLHVYCRSLLSPDEWHVASVGFTITDNRASEPGGPSVELGSSTVIAGESVSISASGFAPDSEVRAELHSDPIELGTLLANGAGLAEGEVVIPASVEPGEHTIVLTGTDPDGGPIEVQAALTVNGATELAEGAPRRPAAPAPSAEALAGSPSYTG